MKRLLTEDEEKILSNFITTPEWMVIKKVLRNNVENSKKIGMGSSGWDEFVECKANYKAALGIISQIENVAKKYTKRNTKKKD